MLLWDTPAGWVHPGWVGALRLGGCTDLFLASIGFIDRLMVMESSVRRETDLIDLALPRFRVTAAAAASAAAAPAAPAAAAPAAPAAAAPASHAPAAPAASPAAAADLMLCCCCSLLLMPIMLQPRMLLILAPTDAAQSRSDTECAPKRVTLVYLAEYSYRLLGNHVYVCGSEPTVSYP